MLNDLRFALRQLAKHSLSSVVIVFSVTLMLPSWVALNTTGEPFEGTGLAPEVFVEHPGPDPTRDPVLAAALERLTGENPAD
ncbi:MAG TPA: hypothetical protein DCY13_13100 [Verrucomicrobiales bacterium]|nr:hypothetical protein [Verrucomicrobiales bacterium]